MPHALTVRFGLVVLLTAGLAGAAAADDKPLPDPSDLIRAAVGELLKMQEDDGAWPYEGVYRVGGNIPIGYRVGGTSIVCTALLYAAPADDANVNKAIDRGIRYVLQGLDHELMKPSTVDTYDVRVWGHGFALDFFCHLRALRRAGEHSAAVEAWIPRLVQTLITEELPKGGWNYANRRAPAAFVTGPITQALLLARSQGENVPAELFDRARQILERMRQSSGNFLYSGTRERMKGDGSDQLPGAIARMAVAEATLHWLGADNLNAVQDALDAFHRHWNELEKRRKKTGTHVAPYGVAPYYFYFGHRYAAQALELLPEKVRQRERARLLEVLLRTRDDDGTWNDRVFPRSRNFGTAMSVMALLRDKAPLPPALPTPAAAWKEPPATQPASAPQTQPAESGK